MNAQRFYGVIEQGRRLLRVVPSPIFRFPHEWRRLTEAQGRAWIADLHERGIVLWPDFMTAAQVTSARAGLERAFGPELAPDMVFKADQQYFASTQPMSFAPAIAEAAVDPDLLNVVSGYFRRVPFLSEADYRRVLPLDLDEHERRNALFAKGHSSSHWHHDVHGREVKVMVYLTDVHEGDQNFAFCVGSHKGFRSTKYERSRFTEDQVRGLNRPVLECYAPAGTAVIFDTNGIHRLRRFNSRIRESVTFNYRPGRLGACVPQRVHAEALALGRSRFERVTMLAADGGNPARS